MGLTNGSQRVSKREISKHLEVNRYGDFELTPAIRPWLEQHVVPRQGYRLETYTDPDSGCQIPTLAAAVSREDLFETFMSLLDCLGETVDVIVESHHERRHSDRRSAEKLREYIDMPVLQSYCHDFHESLMEDGCFGLAVIDPHGPSEVQFDDHKLLVVYSQDLAPFERVLRSYGIPRDDDLKLISEGEHLHSTCPRHAERSDAFCISLGAE